MTPEGPDLPLRAVLASWDEVVEHWDLSAPERALLLGGFDQGGVTDVGTYDAANAERRMRLLVELALVLDRVHGNRRRTRFWLRAPNRRLGGSTPLDVLATSTAWMRWFIDHVGLAQ